MQIGNFSQVTDQRPQHHIALVRERSGHGFVQHAAAGYILEHEYLHQNPLQIIPVIDLMDGHGVHARRGDRSRYRLVRSMLCGSSKPSEIVDALMRLQAFSRLYVADLDAIRGLGDNLRCVRDISHRYPGLDVWLDNGLQTCPDRARRALLGKHVRLVVGSESLLDTRLLGRPETLQSADEPVLSLDFQGDTFLGPPDLLTDASLWPARVIVMSLARVGSGSGPDLDRLRHFAARSPRTEWYAGGGVRNLQDLRDLSTLRVRGALVASALHDGTLGAAELAAYG